MTALIFWIVKVMGDTHNREEVMKVCVMCNAVVSEIVVANNYYLCADTKACATNVANAVFGRKA